MIHGNFLKGQLSKRNITIDTEKTFAGNDIRFFVYKGQKIFFDTETPSGGTTFAWSEEQASNLLFVIDHIADEDQSVYWKMDDATSVNFNWGRKEYLLPVQFLGVFTEFDGKLCKEIGL